MDRERLFGDAKATAHATDVERKRRQLAAARAAYEAEPTADNRVALARALFENGRFEEAEPLLTELMRERSGDIQLTCDLAFVYKNMERLDDAEKMFRRVVALNIRHPLGRCAENELWSLNPRYVPSWMREEAEDEVSEDETAPSEGA